MKSTYSYFSLRFPIKLAKICHCVADELNASYIDLPYLLPIDSVTCKYRYADTISFIGRDFFWANEKIDVCFLTSKTFPPRCFGLINISQGQYFVDICSQRTELKYIFWSNFYDDKIKELLNSFDGARDIRVYADPERISATLRCYK